MTREDARVLLVDHRIGAAEVPAAAIAEEGGQAVVSEADVAIDDDVKALVAESVRRRGCVDILDDDVGIEAMTRALVVDNGRENIRVERIQHGAISTRHAWAQGVTSRSGRRADAGPMLWSPRPPGRRSMTDPQFGRRPQLGPSMVVTDPVRVVVGARWQHVRHPPGPGPRGSA